MRPIGTMSHHLATNLKGSHSRRSCCSFIPAINGRPLPRWANERQHCSIWAELVLNPLSNPPLSSELSPEPCSGGLWVIARALPAPAAIWFVAEGQPITTIASLCARRLLPAGGEREKEWEERAKTARRRVTNRWRMFRGKRVRKRGAQILRCDYVKAKTDENATAIKASKAKEVHDVIKKQWNAREKKTPKNLPMRKFQWFKKQKNNKQTQLPHSQIIAWTRTLKNINTQFTISLRLCNQRQ